MNDILKSIDLDDIFLSDTKENNAIDIVYTFVNPSDTEWLKKYSRYSKRVSKIRFDFTDEQIRFSLLTLAKYAPWVNHIYVVSDNQKFDLGTGFLPKKVTFIDHKDIIPHQFLPTFNSIVIESFLWKIPNLSKYFLYLNDDMFVGRKIEYKDFFSENGKPIQFYGKCSYYNHPWKRNIHSSNVLFDSLFQGHKHICPQHAPYFIQRNIMEKAYFVFEKFLLEMYEKDKIRTYNSYVHNLIFLYAMYASHHNYAVNKHTSFSPIFSLKQPTIENFRNMGFRKKFYCFYAPVRTDEQRLLYKELQDIVLS